MSSPYHQHPLPGATFEVLATNLFWVCGTLYCAALLRAADGAVFVASQPGGCYHPDAPARLFDRANHYRQCADRSSMTAGARTTLRFVMDWSTCSGSLHPGELALFTAAGLAA